MLRREGAVKIIAKFILCFGLVHLGNVKLESKSFFRNMKTFAALNPIAKATRTTTRFVAAANPIIPTSALEIKTDVIDNFIAVQEGAFYRSAQLSAEALESYIKDYGIKTVINLRGENPQEEWWQQEAAVTRRNNVRYVNIPMTASKLTSKKNIREILNVFDTAPRPMLVHCLAGADRTGEVAALWVLDQQHRSRSEALAQLNILHRHNPFMYPSKDFLIQNWHGRAWFENEYNPANYPEFEAQAE